MAELIISEKPSAAERIAKSLADTKPDENKVGKVKYYELKHKGKKILVVCAVGHLYSLTEKIKSGWTYPIFDVIWKPAYDVNKDADFTKNYIKVIEKVAKACDKFTIATDYDQEGEVIGLNTLRYACKQKSARRMKFSTLTKDELIESYENASKHLDKPQAEAGETRHFLDFFYGVNLSRALTLAVKNAGSFKILSTGRVQGPALFMLAKREDEISKFVPTPFWEIELQGNIKKDKISAWHKKGKIIDKKQASEIVKKTKGKKALISSIKKKKYNQKPPCPFDLTTLQIEAYRTIKSSPKQTLALAQQLYTSGRISYPRTSSQKLPPALGYQKILKKLAKQSQFTKLANELLEKPTLTPNEGKKTDPAHPAIYPTGLPFKGEGKAKALYDLITHRFLATFSDPSTRETITLEIDVNKEIFLASGTRTIERGWHKFYGRFAIYKEETLPEVTKDQEVKVKKITSHEKETQPPKRYTPASVIKELEKRNLGTKATRAQIIDSLYQRGYIQDTALKVTDLGLKTINTLKKYCPDILDEDLTKHFETELEKIREKKRKGEKVLDDSKKILVKILKHFKENEIKIGKALIKANRETQEKDSLIGPCPKCKEGTLNIKRGKFGFFVSCDKYETGCATTFSIPAGTFAKSTGKLCKDCDFPKLQLIKKGKRPQEACINPKCKSKKVDKKLLEQKRKCPKCNSELVIRNSIYGQFFACPGYPKCRHTEPIEKFKKKKTKKK
ncbi:MAG: DNA topoisomerase I [Nanoarchaeota archaeon]|nr:DNA topoisomerase I [Nanoarchaeota archaeon]